MFADWLKSTFQTFILFRNSQAFFSQPHIYMEIQPEQLFVKLVNQEYLSRPHENGAICSCNHKIWFGFCYKNLFIAIFGYFTIHEHCFAIILPSYCNTKVDIHFAQVSESAFCIFSSLAGGVCQGS